MRASDYCDTWSTKHDGTTALATLRTWKQPINERVAHISVTRCRDDTTDMGHDDLAAAVDSLLQHFAERLRGGPWESRFYAALRDALTLRLGD